jgi:hypothetical protein
MVKQDCGSCHGMTMKGGLGRGALDRAATEERLAVMKSAPAAALVLALAACASPQMRGTGDVHNKITRSEGTSP